MCALSISERPPPDPRATAITLGRPGAASSSVTSRPCCLSQPATNCAIAASPAPPGTRSGLTESLATNWLNSVAASSIAFISLYLAASETPAYFILQPEPVQACGSVSFVRPSVWLPDGGQTQDRGKANTRLGSAGRKP